VHRSWQTRTALLAWSVLSFCFRNSCSMPLTLFSLRTKRCSRSLHLTIGRTKSVADCGTFDEEFNVFFNVGIARFAAACPPDNCACVPQLFEQLINTTPCPVFLRKFVCQPLCRVPLQIQTFFIKILSSMYTMLIVGKHCIDVCCDEFPMPQIDRKRK